MKAKTMQDLFEHLLGKAYDCEQKLVKKGLPTMIEAASTPELKSALQQHLQETQRQARRLEQVFSIAGKEPDTEKAKVFDQMTDEVEDVIMANLTTMQQPVRSMQSGGVVRGVVRAGNRLVAVLDSRAIAHMGARALPELAR